MRRTLLLAGGAAALVVVFGVAGCGTAKTRFPAELAVGGSPATRPTLAPVPTEPPTTASEFHTAGDPHPLPGGGTVNVRYPLGPVRPPKGVAPAPAGSVYVVVEVTLCAARTGPSLSPDQVDPARFSVEVPGEGLVGFDPGVPQVRGAPLQRADVPPGTCAEGVVPFAVAGEQRVESVRYEGEAGPLRWAS